MDTTIYEGIIHISFEDSFPYPGEVREVIKEDGSEWLTKVLEVSNLEWKIENGKVIGAFGDMKYQFIEEVRSSSKGKLRLV
ncbi:Uncharacterised protein [Chlamydia trachomatis]|nr:Uncharacterised protein [Chlamydia trachomatis]